MEFDEFLRDCERKGRDPFKYLMPVEAFREIDNFAEYTSVDVAHYSNKTVRTATRWFKSGYLKALRKNPWICEGIELKRTLYNEFKEQILGRYKRNKKYPSREVN